MSESAHVAPGARPKIVWDGNTITFRYSLDACAAYPVMRPGDDRRQVRSGEEDAWGEAPRWLLAGDVRYIPATDDAYATGWDGATGWRAFLEYAWAGGAFTFYPDQANTNISWPALLVEPAPDASDSEPVASDEDYTRSMRLVLERADDYALTGYEPHFRARVYKPRSQQTTPPAETDLLVPAVGAAHTDAFAVSTLPEFTDTGVTYKPYLDTVTGRKGELDFRERSTDKGSLALTLLDKRLSRVDRTARWWTAFVGDAAQKSQLLACRVEVDRSLNGGATWARYFTGRIDEAALDGATAARLDLRDMQEDQEQDVFVGQPQAAISYAFPSPLAPLGILHNYGVYGLVGGGTASAFELVDGMTGTNRQDNIDNHLNVLEMDGRKRISYAITETLHALASVTRLRSIYGLPGGYSSGLAGGNNPGNFAMAYEYYGGDVQVVIDGVGTFPTEPVPAGTPGVVIYAHLPTSDTGKQFHITGLWAYGFDDVAWGDDEAVTGIYLVKNAAPTEKAPFFISNVHPVYLWRDLLDGQFGYLDDNGNALATVAYDGAAFTALIADTSFPKANFVVEATATLSDWIEDNICKPFGLAQRLDAQGRVVPIDLRLSAAAAASITLDDADLAAGDDDATWASVAKEAITRVVATYYIDSQLTVAESDDGGDGSYDGHYPPGPPSTIKSAERPLMLVDNTDRAQDLGDHVEKLDATGFRCFVRRDGLLVGKEIVEANLLDALDNLRAPFYAGATPVTLRCLPTADALAVDVGTWCYLDVTKLPNVGTNTRGGEQLAICTGRSEDDEGLLLSLSFLLIGAGADAVQADPPALGAPALTTGGNAHHDITIGVELNADNQRAAVYWIATATTTGTRPSDEAAGWRHAGYVTATGDFAITNAPSGARIWWRARTVPTADDLGMLPSEWVYPYTGSGYVDTTALAAPTGLAVSDRTVSSALIAWTNTELEPIEILWDAASRTSLAASTTNYWFRNITGTHTAGVRYRDPYGGVSPTATISVGVSATVVTAPRMAGIGIQAAGTAGLTGSDTAGGTESLDGNYGIALTLFASSTDYRMELQRAQDDGAGAPDTATWATLTTDIDVLDPFYVDILPNDGSTWHYRARHTYPGVTAGDWTCTKHGEPMYLPPNVAPLPAVLPSLSGVQSQDETTGTLELTIIDAQCRLTLAEWKSKAGTASETSYTSFALTQDPVDQTKYTATLTVALEEGAPSSITIRLTGYDELAVLRVLEERSFIFANSGAPLSLSYVTAEDETALLANSRQLVDGAYTIVNKDTDGQIAVDVDPAALTGAIGALTSATKKIAFHATGMAPGLRLKTMPVDETVLDDSGQRDDLTGYTRARVVAKVVSAGADGATIAVKCSTDADPTAEPPTMVGLDGGAGPVLVIDDASAPKEKASAWIAIDPSLARDTILRVYTAGGDDDTSPVLANLHLELGQGAATPVPTTEEDPPTPPLPSADRFYLRVSAAGDDPGDWRAGYTQATNVGTHAAVESALSLGTKATAPSTSTYVTTGVPSSTATPNGVVKLRRFVSGELAAQTIPGGRWRYALAGKRINYVYGNVAAYAYVWRPSTDATVAVLLDLREPEVPGAAEADYAVPEYYRNVGTTIDSSTLEAYMDTAPAEAGSVVVLDGDRIVLETYVSAVANPPNYSTSYELCRLYFDGTVDVSESDWTWSSILGGPASALIPPAEIAMSDGSSVGPVDTDPDPTEPDPGDIPDSGSCPAAISLGMTYQEIAAGDSWQTAIDANPIGTEFYVRGGYHYAQSVAPKASQRFIGELSGGAKVAILHGRDTTVDAFHGTAADVVIARLIVEHYAGRPAHGMIHGASASGWTIDNIEARVAYCPGVWLGDDFLLSNSWIHDCAPKGVGVSGADGFTVTCCVIERNNLRRGLTQDYDPQYNAAGMKIGRSTNYEVLRTVFRDNDGPGLWVDVDSRYGLIQLCESYDNTNHGFFHEISYDATYDQCTASGNATLWGTNTSRGAQIMVANSENVSITDGSFDASQDTKRIAIALNSDPGRGSHVLRNIEVTGNDVIANGGANYAVAVFNGLNDTAVYAAGQLTISGQTYTLGSKTGGKYWRYQNADKSLAEWQGYGFDP